MSLNVSRHAAARCQKFSKTRTIVSETAARWFRSFATEQKEQKLLVMSSAFVRVRSHLVVS